MTCAGRKILNVLWQLNRIYSNEAGWTFMEWKFYAQDMLLDVVKHLMKTTIILISKSVSLHCWAPFKLCCSLSLLPLSNGIYYFPSLCWVFIWWHCFCLFTFFSVQHLHDNSWNPYLSVCMYVLISIISRIGNSKKSKFSKCIFHDPRICSVEFEVLCMKCF